MCGAMRELVRAEQRVVYSYMFAGTRPWPQVCNKQRASGRKDGYACISGLADICERPHMSTEQRKAAKAAEAGRGANVWSIAGAPERGAMRALIIYVCGLPPMDTSMRGEADFPFRDG